MKLPILASLAAIALTGCSSTQQGALLKDVQGCERHYNGAIGGGGLSAPTFTGTVKIDCDPLPITKANAAKIKGEAVDPVK